MAVITWEQTLSERMNLHMLVYINSIMVTLSTISRTKMRKTRRRSCAESWRSHSSSTNKKSKKGNKVMEVIAIKMEEVVDFKMSTTPIP